MLRTADGHSAPVRADDIVIQGVMIHLLRSRAGKIWLFPTVCTPVLWINDRIRQDVDRPMNHKAGSKWPKNFHKIWKIQFLLHWQISYWIYLSLLSLLNSIKMKL
jgi:hypothetical protein